MAKKPTSLLHLHELFRKVWDERDKSKDDWVKSNNEDNHKEVVEIKGKGEKGGLNGETNPNELGPGAMLSHQDDIFHPDNLVRNTLHSAL